MVLQKVMIRKSFRGKRLEGSNSGRHLKVIKSRQLALTPVVKLWQKGVMMENPCAYKHGNSNMTNCVLYTVLVKWISVYNPVVHLKKKKTNWRKYQREPQK